MCQGSCGTAVCNALLAVAGVSRAEASFAAGSATVWWSAAAARDDDAAAAAVEAIGFDCTSAPDLVLAVEGMMCQQSCGTTVRAAISQVAGVKRCQVSHPEKRAEVWGSFALQAVIDAVDAVGFDAEVASKARGPTVAVPVISSEPTQSVELRVEGVRNGADAKRITAAALGLRGVVRCDVALASRRAIVTYHANDGPAESAEPRADFARRLCARVHKETGFDCAELSTDSAPGDAKALMLSVEGMSCAACSSKVEKSLSDHFAVKSATVSVATHRAKVTLDDMAIKGGEFDATVVNELLAIVKGLGFSASVVQQGKVTTAADFEASSAREVQSWRRTFLWALVLTVPLVFMRKTGPSMAMAMHDDGWCHGHLSSTALFSLFLGSGLQFGVAQRYYRAFWIGAKNGNYGMDALIVIATTVVYVYSVFSMIACCTLDTAHEHIMFETSAMLFCFVSLGKYLEASAKQRTSGAIAALLRMQPTTALLLDGADVRNAATKLADHLSTEAKFSPNAIEFSSTALADGPASPSPSRGKSESNGDAAALQRLTAALDDAVDAREAQPVHCDALQPGDVLKVLPGAAVPCDGVVLSTVGEAFVDEAALTGESRPVRKRRGDAVFGSATATGAMFFMRASRVGSESTLAQIARLVEDAQLSKAPIQEYADVVAAKFTPFIVALSFSTFVAWYTLACSGAMPHDWLDESNPLLFAMLFGVSVVVVACPCALGLATPTAVMVGTGVGATLGVLIKGGDVLEVAQAVNCVVFDKTGTLTAGKPQLTDEVEMVAHSGLLAVAASAEQASEHPIAAAIVGAARARGLKAELDHVVSAEALEGQGVRCALKRLGDVAVGNVALMRFLKVPGVDAPAVAEALARLQRQAKTAVLVSRNGALVGILGVADAPRPESRATIAALIQRGIEVRMLTGDHERTAFAVADTLGIDREFVAAGLLPQHKAERIKALQKSGKKVAMVGDGINDSPALAQADVGLAIGGGTQVAIAAADMVLLRNDLRHVVVALDLARVVYRRIKINFFWAAIYNVVLIPIAAGAFYPLTHARLPPAYAALCMACSSVSVVCSSLTLKFYKPPRIDDPSALKSQSSCLRCCHALRHRTRLALYLWTGLQLYSKCLDSDSDDGRDDGSDGPGDGASLV